MLRTDPAKLKVALLNLIRNAVKFTGAGGVAVHAHAGDGGGEVCVRTPRGSRLSRANSSGV